MKTSTFFKHIKLLVMSLMLVTSCDDSSDRLVYETDSKKHYSVDEVIKDLLLNESILKEQVITIEGFIEDINYLNKRQTILLHGNKDSNSSVICDMQSSELKKIQNLEVGDFIVVKGILKGSLNDVILLSCIISNQANQ